MIHFNLNSIRHLLDEKKISQKELGKLIGKTEQTIGNYLSGKSKIDIFTFVDIVNAIDVPLHKLFDGIGNYDISEDCLEQIKRLQRSNNRKDYIISTLKLLLSIENPETLREYEKNEKKFNDSDF